MKFLNLFFLKEKNERTDISHPVMVLPKSNWSSCVLSDLPVALSWATNCYTFIHFVSSIVGMVLFKKEEGLSPTDTVESASSEYPQKAQETVHGPK